MLSKKYNFKESETKWQNFWYDNNIYKFYENRGDVFSIDTPPPTVSGSLHIGHIFSYTQGEIIARYHRMMGKNVFYPCGFDDNGLPTERLVEKHEGILAKQLPRAEFIKRCIDITQEYEENFKNLWKSIGFSMDWSLNYETINPMVQRISQKSFLRLAKENKAYALEKPVLWCTNCQTSVAQAEVDGIEKETEFIYIPFICEGVELLVATTRPELLYGCVCLYVHPEDERFETLKGKTAEVPLYGFKIPIKSSDKVSREKGTGIVMCATFGDNTDVEWYNCDSLPYKKVIMEDGKIAENIPYLQGMDVYSARKKIIEILSDKKLIRKRERMLHSVSVHERCGTDIEFIISRQWYISILKDKEAFLKAGNEINWYPEYMKNRYEIWVKNLKWDWCISRQRYFGIPFPLWYCKDCGQIMYASEESLPVNPMETQPFEPCSCGSRHFIPESSIMDTWATSSLTTFINSRWEENGDRSAKLLPMSIRTQAHEIIRTWAFYSIVKSLYHNGTIPWKNIMISGFVMAEKGEKISKSKDNSTVTPDYLIGKYSADALRYWSADTRLGSDTIFSEDQLRSSSRFLTKLWNAARFSLMHLDDYHGEYPESFLPVDKWILERAKQISYSASDLLEKNEIGLARHLIDEFFWKDYCDHYLELVKDRLYKPEVHGYSERCSAQYAVFNTFLIILKLYAIYVPHITEEIYQSYFKKHVMLESIHICKWFEGKDSNQADELLINFGEEIKTILSDVRKYKSDRNLSMKEPVETINITVNSEYELEFYEKTKRDIAACSSAVQVKIAIGASFQIQIL